MSLKVSLQYSLFFGERVKRGREYLVSWRAALKEILNIVDID